ncbi:hypothetical protein [Aeromicrobium sp. Leaf291]|uniref:hypothetical protein n=1 Tax=Aeromicrobium sp. Leaf291 TaxID=1736325 RepID=UPI0006FEF8AE|nr:hypothetical protein [Aeromicrobium sp. Leaf291]KQP81585.1 hypothetical protein ASF35_16270 [Aeromicrobium sp. Leaf291]
MPPLTPASLLASLGGVSVAAGLIWFIVADTTPGPVGADVMFWTGLLFLVGGLFAQRLRPKREFEEHLRQWEAGERDDPPPAR